MKLNLLFLTLAAWVPLSGMGQVTYFSAQKQVFYQQTKNDTAPSLPVDFGLAGSVDTTATGDADSFTVSAVDTVTATTSDGTYFFGSNNYNSLRALNAAFPVGSTYTFTAVGGTLNGESDHMHIPPDDFPQIPYLTGEDFTKVSEIAPNTSFTIHFARHGTVVPVSQAAVAIYSADYSTQYYFKSAAASTISFKIPASVLAKLTPGVSCIGQIFLFNLKDVKTTGSFASASDGDGFVTITKFTVKVQ